MHRVTHRYSRREALRLSGLGALALLHPPFLSGCSTRSARGSSDAGGAEWVFDPDVPWWMQHNFAPVLDERTELALEVEGHIPPELDGLYLRNGSNSKFG